MSGKTVTKGSRKPVRKKKRKARKVKVSSWLTLLVSISILGAIAYAYCRSFTLSPDSGDPIPSISGRGFALDLSHHNPGDIDWKDVTILTDSKGRTVREKADATGSYKVSIVFLKATEGVSNRDNRFKERWLSLEDTEMKRGAYHFFISGKSGKEQALNYIKTVGELRHSDMAPVLDIESISKRCTEKEMNERALEWIRTIEEHYGRKPVIYTYESFLSKISDEIKQNYPVWIAHYRTDSPAYKDWKYWQFSDKAVVHGIPGFVDISIIK